MVILVLEIINSILTHKLKANPQLVYSLLHKQEMFAFFRNDLKFKSLIHNIEQAVNYFQQKVSEANINPPTPEEVALVIQNASRTWPPNLMRTFPDIKFQYEEEQQSNEFFCPYVWSLLYRNTFVYWDEEKAKILHDYRVVSLRLRVFFFFFFGNFCVPRKVGPVQIWFSPLFSICQLRSWTTSKLSKEYLQEVNRYYHDITDPSRADDSDKKWSDSWARSCHMNLDSEINKASIIFCPTRLPKTRNSRKRACNVCGKKKGLCLSSAQ